MSENHRQQEIAKAEALAAERKARQRLVAIKKWVEEHGDENQQGRYREGYLPDEEVVEGVATLMFEGMAGREIYVPVPPPLPCERCSYDELEGLLLHNVGTGKLSAAAYDALTEIRTEAPKGARVVPRWHRSTCPSCQLLLSEVVTAEVALDWHGFFIKREYLL